MTPLPLTNSWCNLLCTGLSPASQHPCWAHNFKISFPKEISEQEKLVNLYNSFVAQSDILRNNYYQKIEKLQELKQSILHKAFNGDLS
jgi:type I restriction enzyme S subunit